MDGEDTHSKGNPESNLLSRVVMGWSWETDPDVVEMASCRFGSGCWRPLCPYPHRRHSRAKMWARVWGTLATLHKQVLDALARREWLSRWWTSVERIDDLALS